MPHHIPQLCLLLLLPRCRKSLLVAALRAWLAIHGAQDPAFGDLRPHPAVRCVPPCVLAGCLGRLLKGACNVSSLKKNSRPREASPLQG